MKRIEEIPQSSEIKKEVSSLKEAFLQKEEAPLPKDIVVLSVEAQRIAIQTTIEELKQRENIETQKDEAINTAMGRHWKEKSVFSMSKIEHEKYKEQTKIRGERLKIYQERLANERLLMGLKEWNNKGLTE